MGEACSVHGADEKCTQNFSSKPEAKRPLENSGVGGKITFKWILKKEGVRMWTEFVWLRIG